MSWLAFILAILPVIQMLIQLIHLVGGADRREVIKQTRQLIRVCRRAAMNLQDAEKQRINKKIDGLADKLLRAEEEGAA